MTRAGVPRELVDRHLGLVRSVASQVQRQLAHPIELEDLVAYGVQGLIEAAGRYDEREGTPFPTYAYHRVRGAIYDGLRLMSNLPRSVLARARVAAHANEYLANLAARERGAPRRLPALDEDLDSLYRALQGVAVSYIVSLEAARERGEEPADLGLGADEAVARREDEGRLTRALAALPARERHFIEKHYFEGKTLTEAGQELGLSRSWASRLHARAVERLRAALEED